MGKIVCLTILGVAFFGVCWAAWAADQPGGKKKILFYTQSDGFRHSVVARPLSGELSHAEKIFKELASQAGYEVFFSQSYHDLVKPEQFEQFDAIVTYTSGDPKINREALLNYVRSGKAFVGVHASSDTFKDDETYTKFIGGVFRTHGVNKEPVTLRVEDRNHPATEMLGAEWVIADEIYQFDKFDPQNVHVLLSVDTSKTDLKPQRMEADKYYPLAWTRTEGKGRVFYAGLGHREDVWTNPVFQKHLMGGLAWALGQAESK